ncbi:MAG: hypothetical protein EWM73_03127 [Nitrospira sp.]|nr:MAG: hypothetical protein EWM73_03127 [Nitrospira sp.]
MLLFSRPRPRTNLESIRKAVSNFIERVGRCLNTRSRWNGRGARRTFPTSRTLETMYWSLKVVFGFLPQPHLPTVGIPLT